jgi:predicted transcriptional regulator
MKTAVSMPDELFAAIDARAKALKLSRSALLARAAREFLDRESHGDPTALWNRAIDRGGQPGADPAAAAFMRRSKAVIRGASRSKR